MKKKLWVFGDSNAEGYNLSFPWAQTYVDYLGYKPKYWDEILNEELDTELHNCAQGGTDNYTIFDSIIEQMNNISDGDIVVIFWTTPLRTRMPHPHAKNKYLTILPEYGFSFDEISDRTVQEILISRDNKLCIKEVMGWCKLLRRVFQNNKLVFVSPFTEFNSEQGIITPNWWKEHSMIMIISSATFNALPDGHFSEQGCVVIADLLKKYILEERNFL